MSQISCLGVATVALTALASVATAQPPPRVLTNDDYARAEKFMPYNTTPLVFHAGVRRPAWLPDGRFWYRTTTAEGSEFVVVDPARKTRGPAFDQAKLATALSAAAGTAYDAFHLPFIQFDLAADGRSLSFAIGAKRWTCDLPPSKCTSEDAKPGETPNGRGGPAVRTDVPSPDRRLTAFIRDENLWVREIATGKETPLTADGVKDFGYATDNAGWSKSDRPILVWSPDSKKIATDQQDQRGVGEMYLVDTRIGHPNLTAWKYPLPGDAMVTTIQRVVIDLTDLTAPRIIRLQMPPDQHRSTLCDDMACLGEWGDVQWSPNGTTLAFVSTSRDHKQEQLRVADAATGVIRDVLSERVSTFFESGNGRVNWRYLPSSNEVIWFSERDNWGQLYLYDLKTGELKQQITTGEGNVTQLLHVDEQQRLLYFLGVGKETGRDPYFNHFYRIGFDGQRLELLTPEDANHDVSIDKSGRFFVDSYSKPDAPPMAVLRDADGRMVLTLETADISQLVAAGWKPPIPITVKARDGVTDLYGLMYRPTDFDASKKYPIVNHVYPGPQTGSVGGRSFVASRGDDQSLAELGFVVVEIDGTGTPWRSKKFHEASYGDMGDNTLPDQIAAMKELAARYPWVDLDRAGIWGHSGGGFAAADAMFRYPDFFKAGISESGNHDNRVYEDDWAEKWQGLLVKNPDGTTNYDAQANQNVAQNLKGRLLLAHGTMDPNVPPNSTLLVVDALIKANKDFDLLMLPNQAHGYGSESNYMTRRRWDYFVRYLMGAEPPKEYQMKPPTPAP
jgi:dipeptidyl aminopeptidase/acylaminoacyl peptidase